MAKQNPPDPWGKETGFPYQLFWDQFGPLWESLLEYDFTDPSVTVERLAAKLDSKEVLLRRMDQAAIETIVKRHGNGILEPDALVHHLRQFAAIYLMPELQKALHITPREVQRDLKMLEQRARSLTKMLRELDSNVLSVLLGNQQSRRRAQSGLAGEVGLDSRKSLEDLYLQLEDLSEGCCQANRNSSPLAHEGQKHRL